MNKGGFIAFEGPNGAGKTTILDAVCRELANERIEVLRTKEPTLSDLGKYIRTSQNVYSKEVLACLVAANRYEHLETIILPAIEKGTLVLTDRYFPSSLVYQIMDGLDASFVENLNQRILVPDFTVFLLADAITLTDRLQERDKTTRFEQNQSTEIQLYEDAVVRLTRQGWNLLTLNTGGLDIPEITSNIIREIKKVIQQNM